MALLLPTTAGASTGSLNFYGEGSGHGVGFSQYGAKGMAAGGASYQEILNRYFTGTALLQVGQAGGTGFLVGESQPVWVGLLQDQTRVSFNIDTGSAKLCFDRSGECAGTAVEGEVWSFEVVGPGSCAFLRNSGDGQFVRVGPERECEASVQPQTGDTTYHVPRKARLYRSGNLRFRPAGDNETLHLVLQTDVETYVKGLSEVPESWPVESVRAQVVVSRSLAAWNLLERGSEQEFDSVRREECHCNLRDNSSPQLFRGYTGQLDHPNWVAATQATAGEVVTVSSAIAYTPYFHSSAGWTENYVDVFGGGGYSHLVSVNDAPAISKLVENPLRYWGRAVALRSIATLFEFSWVNDLQVVDHNPSGTVRSIAISGIRGGRPTAEVVSGVELKTALGLASAVYAVVVESRFVDIPPGHPFAGEVTGLLDLGITKGCTLTAFCPEAMVTRGEMAAFLVRSLGLEPLVDSLNPFTDDDGSIFEQDIKTLHEHGITTGCNVAKFCPEDVVTRGEMAAFLVRAFDLPPGAGSSFVDDAGSYFEGDIAALAASGVTSGCTFNRYCPDRPVSRQEAAAFLVRVLALP